MAPCTQQQLLAHLISANKALSARYLAGFDDASAVAKVPGLPNHAAWCLGHCALTMHKVAGMLDGKPLPDADFIDKGTANDAQRFGTEVVCFGSEPATYAGNWPGLTRCVAIYDNTCDRLSLAASRATDTMLDSMLPWGASGMTIKANLLVARMSFHNGFHTGQIADMRRALGMKSALG